jgi:hypothetical protein
MNEKQEESINKTPDGGEFQPDLDLTPKEYSIADGGEQGRPDLEDHREKDHSEKAERDEVGPETPLDEIVERDKPEDQTAPKVESCDGKAKSYVFDRDTVTVICKVLSGDLRSYTIKTTHPLLDNDPPAGEISFSEREGDVLARSGNMLFDALFAMAIEEVRQNSLPFVQDGAFQKGQPVSCECFQTGAKWGWAWTRDLAYSIDLSLASVDPQRSSNTLLFKISQRKASAGGGDVQIIQDTGTGGSWPVSSDRVTWAMGAWRLYHFLADAKRKSFLEQAYPALVNTIALDRKARYDQKDGLYRGEQSFLDWREQSYPAWVKNRLEHIAMSKALSTNVNHLLALDIAAEMADISGKKDEASQYRSWASSLRSAIHREFYLPDDKLYSTMKTTDLDSSPVHKYDLLGNALAIIANVADDTQADAVVANYPNSVKGPPVIWPQQPLTPIYHNRALWPFVTAYWVLAARKTANDAAVTHGIRSLYRQAALNLSNMENFEFVTGANKLEDGDYTGPVINSRRQLWSVAGYISAIQDVIFGLQVNGKGIRFRPFLPLALRRDWFAGNEISLKGLNYRGHRIDIKISLPNQDSQTDGAYEIDSITLNGSNTLDGQPLTDQFISATQLQAQNSIEIALSTRATKPKPIRIVHENGDFRTFWSPKEPIIKEIKPVNGKLQIEIDSNGEKDVRHHIYRDGVRIASDVPTGTWIDPNSSAHNVKSHCYSADSVFPTTGNRSHHALPSCWLGSKNNRMQTITAWRFAAEGGKWSSSGQAQSYIEWGDAGDFLEVAAFKPNWTGPHLVRLVYRNPSSALNTGISCAVKRLEVYEIGNSKPVSEGLIVMPTSADLPSAESSLLKITLEASKTYRLRIVDADVMANMTYLQHFAMYTGSAGGGDHTYNRAEIHALRIFPLEGADHTPNTGQLIAFNGVNDLDKFADEQKVTPGLLLETWERFAMTWDDDWLYIAVVTKAFQNDLYAFLLYIEAASGSLPAPQTSRGMTYLTHTSHLPFQPTHAIGVRYNTDVGDGFGHWNGIWHFDNSSWRLQTRLEPKAEYHLASDRHTISYRIHRAELGWPKRIRLAAHLVQDITGHEWKIALPPTHTPWQTSTTGFYEIDLDTNKTAASWSQK